MFIKCLCNKFLSTPIDDPVPFRESHGRGHFLYISLAPYITASYEDFTVSFRFLILIKIDNIKLPLSSNDVVGKFLINKNGSVIDVDGVFIYYGYSSEIAFLNNLDICDEKA